MRIAMDGSFLCLPPSGTSAYIRGLEAGFRELGSDIDLTLLSPDCRPSQRRVQGSLGRLTGAIDAIWRDDRLRRMRWDLYSVDRGAKNSGANLLHIPHFSAPLRSSKPLVVTIHDVIPLVLPEYQASTAMKTRLSFMRRTVKQARIVLAPSNAAAADIERVLEIPVERIRVTPEAVDSCYVPAPDRAAAKQAVARFGINGKYVFNVGGLDVRKNLIVLIEAFAMARADLPEGTKLVIAGAAHSDNKVVFPPLQPVIDRHGLNDHVLLLGRVSERDKLLLFQAADLYVTPSLYEGFGLTALEAMACGVPTIASYRTSLPEVVGDGGLLVEPFPVALSMAMSDVLSNHDLSAALRNQGLQRASQFSWRRTAELTLAAYREAVAETMKD